ncbi:electron transport complex subunit RsxC [Dethiobacter alkaliphilus]|uniref:Ion-translocating oxidoreductase complex subunit C n=1 Tax=Dethiobacter alkaliphilus AHT 1 TaxID=555088 RepID=C0GEY5_DETAL|nr:electron transport complex subunit RsxC [Dethiobacter alkaliphilus]EEG78167.1 electron transport complex, RnfABCDGE type, C subunit [Dethiobacter alkaliphilus AHT 1]
MSFKTFKGGVHPGHFKSATEKKPVVPAKPPTVAIIPMSQHIGAPCEPLVAVGDEVKVGQKVGDSKGFVSAPVHSSVSGKVVKIDMCNHPLGRPVQAVFIENDFQDTWHEDVKPNDDWKNLGVDDLKKIIREAGIVGMGGATFPTHVKVSPPPDQKIDYVLINAAECEPYLTSDHRAMLERPEDVVIGLQTVMKVVNAPKGYIGIEDNKPDAVEAMKKAAEGIDNIEVHALHTKYPQGAEKQLISVFTGREVPSGGLPSMVGCVVQNVGTCIAISEAIRLGKPLIERNVTITGSGINEPKNMLVRVGTPMEEVIEQCGGFKPNIRKMILGGPMMGLAQSGPENQPVIKGTSGILCLTDAEVTLDEIRPCIKCAKCVEVCPVSIMPLFIGGSVEHGMYDKAEAFNAMDCIECGCCTYICPAKRPLVQWIRMAKGDIAAKRRK